MCRERTHVLDFFWRQCSAVQFCIWLWWSWYIVMGLIISSFASVKVCAASEWEKKELTLDLPETPHSANHTIPYKTILPQIPHHNMPYQTILHLTYLPYDTILGKPSATFSVPVGTSYTYTYTSSLPLSHLLFHSPAAIHLSSAITSLHQSIGS